MNSCNLAIINSIIDWCSSFVLVFIFLLSALTLIFIITHGVNEAENKSHGLIKKKNTSDFKQFITREKICHKKGAYQYSAISKTYIYSQFSLEEEPFTSVSNL